MLLTIALWIFAVIGVLSTILILWCIIDEIRSKSEYKLPQLYDPRFDEPFKYLDNEVRGTMRRIDMTTRGIDPLNQPTLKGRVDQIEKYLGVEVYVEPAKQAELHIRKVATNGRTSRKRN